MTDRHCVAAMDVGGTALKTGLIREDGSVVPGSARRDSIDSGGTARSILASFSAALARLLTVAERSGLQLDGIGISICGPFEYDKGISRIKDLDKYEAIYGIDVKENLQRDLNLSADFPFFFDPDAWSFARGEVWLGAGKAFKRVIAFTMGTGVGSAFAADGRIVSEGPGVPWCGWISGQKYRQGILNDYLSRTRMIARYRQRTGMHLDVKEMAARALEGESDALEVFQEVGRELGVYLRKHHVEEFGAECLIFGGQISKSFDLFVPPLMDELKEISCLREILPAADIEGSALKGAAKLVFDRIAE